MDNTALSRLEAWLDRQIIGQQALIHKLMIALLAASFYFVGYSLEDVMNPGGEA